MAHQLVVGRVGEPHELDLGDGSKTGHRQAEGGADDSRLGHRRVHHPLLAETLDKTVGDAEDASGAAHVLPHEQDPVVGLHLEAERIVEGLSHVHLGHQTSPRSRRRSARCLIKGGVASAYMAENTSDGPRASRASARATASSIPPAAAASTPSSQS